MLVRGVKAGERVDEDAEADARRDVTRSDCGRLNGPPSRPAPATSKDGAEVVLADVEDGDQPPVLVEMRDELHFSTTRCSPRTRRRSSAVLRRELQRHVPRRSRPPCPSRAGTVGLDAIWMT